MKNFLSFFLLLLTSLLTVNCRQEQKPTSAEATVQTDADGYAVLTSEQMEDLVKHSYQYVALFNINNKFAMTQGGWNTLKSDTKLKDHTLTDIARPNNDTFYASALMDLRDDAMILKYPGFDSKYVSLMIPAYDHYVNIPLSTTKGDFAKAGYILVYSDHTNNYKGEKIEGIETYFKASGDFVSAIFRVMPHASEPERFDKVVKQIQSIEIMSLSEYQGKEKMVESPVEFPGVGKTDADVFENNLLEVMQFVFNHTAMNPENPLDKAVLDIYKPLGIVPGGVYTSETGIRLNGKEIREVSERVKAEELKKATDETFAARVQPKMFRPKGQSDLETLLNVSVLGPIGLPMEQAMYPSVTTLDGQPLNAMNDYVIRMRKDELPPARAFWSLTLYDLDEGFFIPNDRKKYSVGENAGMKLDAAGGIEIYIAAEKPAGVPEENWLPIERKDLILSTNLRIYQPDLEAMKTWKAPVAEKL